MNLDQIQETLLQFLLNDARELAITVVVCLVIYLVGSRAIKYATKMLKTILLKSVKDPTLTTFLVSIVNVSLRIFLAIIIIGRLGIETTAFAALIASAGIMIGAALSGSLQNFAAGVMILLFHPYKVGDWIASNDVEGTVTEIQMFNTVLTNLSNEVIIIPNAQVTSGIIKNFTMNEVRRLDFEVGISYSDDIDKAKEIASNALKSIDLIDHSREALIEVTSLGDSSVNLSVSPWVKPENYVELSVTLPEVIKKAFDKNDISIPFPQRDIHMINS